MLFGFVNQSISDFISYLEPFPKESLRGVVAAEGNASTSVERAPSPDLGVGVVVSNSDLEPPGFARNLLPKLGFNPGRVRIGMHKGERTDLGIALRSGRLLGMSGSEDVKRFASGIGFAESAKQT